MLTSINDYNITLRFILRFLEHLHLENDIFLFSKILFMIVFLSSNR